MPQSIRLLEGGWVEMLFGKMPFEHAVSLHGPSLVPYAIVISDQANYDMGHVWAHSWKTILILRPISMTINCNCPLAGGASERSSQWARGTLNYHIWTSCQINWSQPLSRSALICWMTILSSKQPKSTPPFITQLAFWRNTLTVLHHHPLLCFLYTSSGEVLCPTLVCKSVGCFQRDEGQGRLAVAHHVKWGTEGC